MADGGSGGGGGRQRDCSNQSTCTKSSTRALQRCGLGILLTAGAEPSSPEVLGSDIVRSAKEIYLCHQKLPMLASMLPA